MFSVHLLQFFLSLVCDEPWQPEQVVSGAAEDEDPVDPGQATQFLE